jgi:flagellar biosynthesis/type III secretory pathway protein FliH
MKRMGKKATCKALLAEAKGALGDENKAMLAALEMAFEAGYDDGYAKGRSKGNQALVEAAKNAVELGSH